MRKSMWKLSILTRRKDMESNSSPTVVDGIFVFLLVFLSLVTVGSYLQVHHSYTGLILSQIIMVAIPLIYGLLIKMDFKKCLSFRKFQFEHILIALLVWFLAFMVTVIYSLIFAKYLHMPEELNKYMHEMVNGNFLLAFFSIAIVPAICEEIIFRGFLLNSFDLKDGTKKAAIISVVVSSLLFGVLHVYPIKIVQTAVLGLALGYIAKRSKSIYPAMFIHFMNNSLAVVALYLSQFMNS